MLFFLYLFFSSLDFVKQLLLFWAGTMDPGAALPFSGIPPFGKRLSWIVLWQPSQYSTGRQKALLRIHSYKSSSEIGSFASKKYLPTGLFPPPLSCSWVLFWKFSERKVQQGRIGEKGKSQEPLLPISPSPFLLLCSSNVYVWFIKAW